MNGRLGRQQPLLLSTARASPDNSDLLVLQVDVHLTAQAPRLLPVASQVYSASALAMGATKPQAGLFINLQILCLRGLFSKGWKVHPTCISSSPHLASREDDTNEDWLASSPAHM